MYIVVGVISCCFSFFVVVYDKYKYSIYIYILSIVITFCLEHFVFITLFGCNNEGETIKLSIKLRLS